MKKSILMTLAVLCVAGNALATTFIVPDDVELVQKSDAIVTGVVLSARAVVAEDGYIETHYELALDRVLKGPFRAHAKITIQSPGGSTESRYTVVESAAHFRIGDEVLLFLTRHRGGWTTTDLTLGKFTFAVSSGGHSVAVRDAQDIVGWDRNGNVHREKIRRDAEFVQFIQETVAGRTPIVRDYEADPADVLAPPASAPPSRRQPVAELFPAPAHTYAVSIYDCSLNRYPARFPTTAMNAGVAFLKNSTQNASGLGDGGVAVIQAALNAWTNDCGSTVNIPYGGTAANTKADDGVNMIIFNDPGNHIAGTFGSSGVIAMTFSSANDIHSFADTDFASISDSDIVFQNGYTGTASTIEEAMTHEIGHAIGFRHADRHHLQNCTINSCVPSCTETACNPSVEDCSTNAIMTASVSSVINYTLQTWDMSAADALYPGTCVVVTPPTNVVATATSASEVNVTWTAVSGAVSYNVYRSTDGTNYALAGSVTAPTVTFNDLARSSNTAFLYKVRAVNGGESGDSNIDLATTVIFTDNPLVAGTTAIKAAHITELRTAVNAVRTLASLGAGTYTDPTVTAGVTTVKAAHVTELRTALDQARSALALSTLSYADPITAGTSTVKASHITELRNGVK